MRFRTNLPQQYFKGKERERKPATGRLHTGSEIVWFMVQGKKQAKQKKKKSGQIIESVQRKLCALARIQFREVVYD